MPMVLMSNSYATHMLHTLFFSPLLYVKFHAHTAMHTKHIHVQYLGTLCTGENSCNQWYGQPQTEKQWRVRLICNMKQLQPAVRIDNITIKSCTVNTVRCMHNENNKCTVTKSSFQNELPNKLKYVQVYVNGSLTEHSWIYVHTTTNTAQCTCKHTCTCNTTIISTSLNMYVVHIRYHNCRK